MFFENATGGKRLKIRYSVAWLLLIPWQKNCSAEFMGLQLICFL
jgi:hypothetical protein